MWNLPGPGIEPISSALAGGFLTTGPPGKSRTFILKKTSYILNKLKDTQCLHFFFFESRTKHIYTDVCVSISHSVVSDSVTPCIIAHQAPLSMEFSRQEYWTGLPFPSLGIFLTQRSNLALLHCRQILYRLSYQGNPTQMCVRKHINIYV